MNRLFKGVLFVSSITIIGVTSAIGGLGIVAYKYTAQDIITQMEQRANNVHLALADRLSSNDFELINTPDDMSSDAYKRVHEILNSIQISSGLKYLYTVKITPKGKYIFVVDGLNFSDGNFEKVGNPIYEEDLEDISDAMRGEIKISTSIKNSISGLATTAYYPIKNHGRADIIGVLAMQFDMTDANARLENIAQTSIIIGFFLNFVALLIVLALFIRAQRHMLSKLSLSTKLAKDSSSILSELAINSNDGIFVLSLDEDKMLVCNAEFKRIYGVEDNLALDFERFLRLSDRQMLPGEYHDLCAKLKNLSGSPDKSIATVFHINNETRKISFTVKAVFKERITATDERILIITVTDITSQKQEANTFAFERGLFKDALISSSSTVALLDLTYGYLKQEDILKSSEYSSLIFKELKTPTLIDEILGDFVRKTKPLSHNNSMRVESSVASLMGIWDQGIKHFANRFCLMEANVNFSLLLLFGKNEINGHIYVCFMTHDVSKGRLQDLEKDQRKVEVVGQNIDTTFMIPAYSKEFLIRIYQEACSPVVTILNLLHLCNGELNDVTVQAKYHKLIEFSALKSLSFLNNIIYMRQIKINDVKLRYQPVDIIKLMHECCDIIKFEAERHNITCILNIDGEFKYPVVYASREHLRQVILNLAENAFDNNKENGLIIFELHAEKELDAEFQTVRFVIKDTGTGMSEEYLQDILVHSNKHINTSALRGFGLPVVQGLLEAMDTQLRLISEQGDGVTAEFILSLRGVKTSNNSTEVPKGQFLQGKRIVIGENNVILTEVMTNIFAKTGAQISIYPNGTALAEDLAGREDENCDLVILEEFMPICNGLETIALIRQGHSISKTISQVPILLITPKCYEEEQLNTLGITDIIYKPVNADLFLYKVNLLCNRQKEMYNDSVTKAYRNAHAGFGIPGHRIINLKTPVTWGPAHKRAHKTTKKNTNTPN